MDAAAARKASVTWCSSGSPPRLALQAELRFTDQAHAADGQVVPMMQMLLETGARASEFVALRVEDVSLCEPAMVIEGGNRRKVPIHPGLARLVSPHLGRRNSRWTGP